MASLQQDRSWLSPRRLILLVTLCTLVHAADQAEWTCAQMLDGFAGVEGLQTLPLVHQHHPVLRQVATPVPEQLIGHPKLIEFIDKLIEAMYAHGGIGIAAPQVGFPIRVFVANTGYINSIFGSPAVFVNPAVKVLDPRTTCWVPESCLSIPRRVGAVPRFKKIEVYYLDREGNPHTIQRTGLWSVVLQHENDHLDGRLFIDLGSINETGTGGTPHLFP